MIQTKHFPLLWVLDVRVLWEFKPPDAFLPSGTPSSLQQHSQYPSLHMGSSVIWFFLLQRYKFLLPWILFVGFSGLAGNGYKWKFDCSTWFLAAVNSFPAGLGTDPMCFLQCKWLFQTSICFICCCVYSSPL